MKKFLCMAFVAAAALIGCSEDTTNTVGAEVSKSVKDLPKCNADLFGEMRAVSEDGLMYYCNGKDWETLSGSSEKGKDGESCTMEALESKDGYKILCGGDSVGVVLNGKDGSDGKDGDDGKNGSAGKDGQDGEPGEVGKDGSSCSIVNDEDGVVTISCGEDDDAETTMLYKAMCGSTPYDPALAFCEGGVLHKNQMKDDRDGQVYKVLKIGSQIWMAENLNYAYLQPSADEDSSSFCYDDDLASCEKYGRLYKWSAAVDSAALFSDDAKGCGVGVVCKALEDENSKVRGVCPNGWHLSSAKEWETLFKNVGGSDSAGTHLKSTEGWLACEDYCKDSYGFNVLAAGSRYDGGSYAGSASFYAAFWTSFKAPESAVNELNDYAKSVVFANNRAWGNNTGWSNMENAFSIRCVHD